MGATVVGADALSDDGGVIARLGRVVLHGAVVRAIFGCPSLELSFKNKDKETLQRMFTPFLCGAHSNGVRRLDCHH